MSNLPLSKVHSQTCNKWIKLLKLLDRQAKLEQIGPMLCAHADEWKNYDQIAYEYKTKWVLNWFAYQ